jgi:hypothetical protein
MAAKKYHSVGINDKIAKYLLASSIVDEGQSAEPEDAVLRVKDEQVD